MTVQHTPIEKSIGQDGFSIRLSETSAQQAVRKPGLREQPIKAESGRLIFSDNGDGTSTIERCVDLMADDLDLSADAGNRHVTMIAARAFQHCGGIRRIVLPEGLLQIGEMAFLGCAQLQRVDIPGTVERIGALAFARCQKLTHVRIQPGVRSIGPSVFQKCPSLLRVDLPRSVVSFGSGIFLGSPQVTLYSAAGSTAEQYAKANGILFDSESWKKDSVLDLQEKEDGTLMVTGIKSSQRMLEIPRELCGRAITEIAPYAFCSHKELESVHINGTRVIGERSFMGCSGLMRVVFRAGLEEIGPEAFSGCEKLPQITLPEGIKTVGQMAFFGCTHLSYVQIPLMANLGNRVFEGCSPLLRVYSGTAH